MNVVIDTNVIVSALLTPPGPSGEVVRMAGRGLFVPLFDHCILSEYEEVLSRPKFGFPAAQVKEFLGMLEARGLRVAAIPLAVKLPDPDDLSFLEVALSGKAEVLVTGNLKDYPLRWRGDLAVLSPSEFRIRFAGSLPHE